MSGREGQHSGRSGKKQGDALRRLVGLFEARGWLNRSLRISRAGASYRVFCSDTEFQVYRINDNAYMPPGVPGWPVCMVGRDHVFHDSEMCPFPSPEPGPEDWLHCLAGGDFETLTELP